jgi:hypothetical protein
MSGEGDGRQNGSHLKGGIEPSHLAMAARSIPSCSFNVTVSRRAQEASTLSTGVIQ